MAEKNYVLGAGRIYIALEDDEGNATALRYIGNTPEFSFTLEATNLELFDSDGPIATKVEDVVTQVVRSGSVTVNDIGLDNLALFLVADKASVVQDGTPVASYAISAALQGFDYQLGESAENPTGDRGISSVTVQDTEVAPTTFDVDDDYTVDPVTGLLHIVEGGAIVDGTDLVVAYTPAASSRDQLKTNSLGLRYGALKFIADNTRGANRDFYAPRVKIQPNGDMAYKSRDTWMQMQFNLEYLVKDALSAVYLDGAPVASGTA